MSTPADTIKQLNSARDIVLRDPTIYPQVVPGVLPVIGPSTTLEQRRWGADFLAETFASPVVSGEDKEKMCIGSGVLDTLRGYLNRKEDMGQDEDPAVVKSAVQCAASIYPLVFRHTMNSSNDEAWRKLATIKSSILRRMDTAPSGVRICCVKFVAMVVQVQTRC
jgi:symplekin